MTRTFTRKPYEAPESEAITFMLEPVCLNPSEITDHDIIPMGEVEDL